MNQKKLSFIIVNYATKGLIEKNITNLLNSWSNCEVILVDNDSPDGSADYVEKRFGKDPV
jgi:GT2 family glycosyltransferase